MEHTKSSCIDCGAAPVSHHSEYVMAFSQVVLSPVYGFLDRLTHSIFSIIPTRRAEKYIPKLFRLAQKLHLGVIRDAYDDRNSYRTKVMWDEARARGFSMYEFRIFGQPVELYYVVTPSRVIVFDGLPRPDGPYTDSLHWMDDKDIMRRKFQAAGLLVSRGGCARTKEQALEIFHRIDKPCITKPNLGSRSRHTYVHLETEEQFLKGFFSAKQLSPWVVIEEELQGQVHRGTLVNGNLIAVMNREAPFVIGDGVSSIKELVDKENNNPARQGPIFHTISFGEEMDMVLQSQQLTVSSILEKGRKVYVHPKVGRGSGGCTTDCTDETHPEIKEMLQNVARTLQDPLIGVDFIVADITKSLREQPKSGIIECNSLPFIDIHHYPLYGKVRNVAGALWDAVLK